MKKEKQENKSIKENWIKTQPRSEKQQAINLLKKCKEIESKCENELVNIPIHNGYIRVLKCNIGCKCEGKMYVQDVKTGLFFCNKCGASKPANSKKHSNSVL